jgi:8-oxo-dGTP pyrophosphatase MutT (NUDIX family)
MENSKKRRGTIILENENGILLARTGSDERLMLPGGHAEHREPRIIAAIRELYEETKLKAIDVNYLFDFESNYYFHKVFLINADGIPEPSNEVSFLNYYHPLNSKMFPEISKSSFEIIQKYLSIKSNTANK